MCSFKSCHFRDQGRLPTYTMLGSSSTFASAGDSVIVAVVVVVSPAVAMLQNGALSLRTAPPASSKLLQALNGPLCSAGSSSSSCAMRARLTRDTRAELHSEGEFRPAGFALVAGLAGQSLLSWRRRRRGRTAVGAFGGDTKEKKTRVRLTEDMPRGSDFYQLLGVDRLATQDEIRTAYKRTIRQTHPDVNPAPEAAEKFMQAQEAFRWLSDPQQRAVYDGVGSRFGQDAIYDYTDEPILGSLTEVQLIHELTPAMELVNQCRKELTFKRGVKIDTTIKDIRKRYRKYGLQRVIFVRNYICRELKRVLAYPKLIKTLHPFERLSVELSLTHHFNKEGVPFGKILACLKAVRLRVHEEGVMRSKACWQAERGRLATFIADEGIETMFDLITSYEPIFQQFSRAQKAILKAPCINLDKPTVVFVGAPNVGKSSLVRSISTGRPEVRDYVYTTKQLTIGHLWHFIAGTPLLIHGQIVDSPGLKSVRGGNPNLMDQLTMGSMEHLPTGVVFVFDPYPYTHGILDLDEQLKVRDELRARFPRRPWLDVVTKIDRPEIEAQENIARLSKLFPEIIQVSALDGTGLDVLNMEVRGLLEEMTKVVRQLQRTKIRQLRTGAADTGYVGKEALTLRAVA
mmetsp:Transcript_51459/g.83449  ORF Transcript_51459/g.83449 Transcript_51459/m.83449 type:complete len:629 (-) Transcript_51459:95-1981(-)